MVLKWLILHYLDEYDTFLSTDHEVGGSIPSTSTILNLD